MNRLRLLGLGFCGLAFLGLLGQVKLLKADNTRFHSPEVEAPTMLHAHPNRTQKKIRLALLLDTSGSMSGLIDQARAQLWNIVNEMAGATSEGLAPSFEIALYQYGNSGISASESYIRQMTGFTADLDRVSQVLFELTTSGGDEYCGEAMVRSLDELEWAREGDAYQAIFIAGNEPFTQGSVAPEMAFQKARKKNVFVNAIFCGNQEAGISQGWNAAQVAALGGYASIDHNQQVVYKDTPFDKEIADLNAQLNQTYVYYGEKGRSSYDNMNVQDNNVASMGTSNMVSRALTINGRFYLNQNYCWDLVDKMRQDPGFNLGTIEKDNLPEEMKKLSLDQKKAFVAEKMRKRDQINARIAELGAQRADYLKKMQQSGDGEGSLESAMVSSIRAQARSKGFAFGDAVDEFEFTPALVDYDHFLKLAQEVRSHRQERLVNFNDWLRLSREPNTIILDTRSKANYDAMHIAGAIHINFSAFNAYDLARLIPDKNTRILIYCNNNIDTDTEKVILEIAERVDPRDLRMNFVSKMAPPKFEKPLTTSEINSYSGADSRGGTTMALNVPTYITLFGYGYENVYELSELVKPNDPRLQLEGTAISKPLGQY